MNRYFSDLSEQERDFINAVYVDLKSYKDTATLLGVDLDRIRVLNTTLDLVWRPITKVRAKWRFKNIGGNFWDFYHWSQSAEQKCHYCGISQEEITLLHTAEVLNKRTTRGKTLELDRKNPNDPYSNISNLTYCCYWCNNAKTDTFTEEEFKVIGIAIALIWKARLDRLR
jgi:hypothetical protein